MCEADRQTDRRSLDEGSDERSNTFNPTNICRRNENGEEYLYGYRLNNASFRHTFKYKIKRNENGEEYLWIQIDRITRHFDTRLNIK